MLYDGLDIVAERGVYFPREDSGLLAGVVEEHAFGKTLDLGCGTGVQGIVAALKGCKVTFSDIDASAVSCARRNARANGVKGTFLISDMFHSVKGKFNTIIFNPPYLDVRDPEERPDKNLDGGVHGRDLLDRFLAEYKKYVMKEHVILLLESSVNKYEDDAKKLDAEIVAKGHYFFEDLAVLKFK